MSILLKRLKFAACGALVSGVVGAGLAHPAAAAGLVWKTSPIAGFAPYDDAVTGVTLNPSAGIWTCGTVQASQHGVQLLFIVALQPSDGTAEGGGLVAPIAEGNPTIATDHAGNTVLGFNTDQDLISPNLGNIDAVLLKFDTNVNVLWAKQFGTALSDKLKATAVDADNNIFVTGSVSNPAVGPTSTDVWVAKFDPDGNQLWRRQFGTKAFDSPGGIAVDSAGSVYVVGSTEGALAGPLRGTRDAFAIKFDNNGNQQWRRQIGTVDSDDGFAIAADTSDNVYLAGVTVGNIAGPNKGPTDAWLMKLDSGGQKLWRRGVGTVAPDTALAAAIDTADNVYLTGTTQGSLGGANKGGADVFLMKVTSSNQVLYRWQRGTSSDEAPLGIAVDADQNAYIVGESGGSFAGPNQGGTDGFVVKVNTGVSP